MNTPALRAEEILGFPVSSIARWNRAVTISPEQAKSILEAQPSHQRDVDQRHVERLASEMRADRFEQSNHGIAFDEDGLLFDGQHRLWACFFSGKPITVLCCFNEPRANFDKIDRVQKLRSEGDILRIEGIVENATFGNMVVAAARYVFAYEAGANPVNQGNLQGWDAAARASVLVRHPGLMQMCEQIGRRRRPAISASAMAGLVTLMEEVDRGKAAIFLHQVLTGENIRGGDPAFTFRVSMASEMSSRRGARMDGPYRFVRAWNAFYEGREIRKLYGTNAANGSPVRKGGMDPFPRIAGHSPTQLFSSRSAA